MFLKRLTTAAAGVVISAALLPSLTSAGLTSAVAAETFLSPAECTGTSGPARIFAAAGQDVLCGLGGSDGLAGKSGDDILLGDSRDDLLNGDAARDMPVGAPANDSLIGGSRDDLLNSDAARDMPVGDQVDSFIGGPGSDKLTAVDTCATDSADMIRGICQEDRTGPVISEVTAPSSVDAGSELVISWRASDSDGLWIPNANTPTTWALIGGPNGYVSWCDFPTSANQVSGDLNSGLFTANCLVPVNAVNGEYSFWLDALDVFGNHNLGSTFGTFMVTSGATDSAPPVVSEITLSGTTFTAGDAITFDWNATDESGVSGSIPWAFGPNGFLVNGDGELWLDYGLGSLVSGTVIDGHYRVTLQLSVTAAPGTYTLWFHTSDVLGNRSFTPVSATFMVS